jgi:hypothetical protein
MADTHLLDDPSLEDDRRAADVPGLMPAPAASRKDAEVPACSDDRCRAVSWLWARMTVNISALHSDGRNDMNIERKSPRSIKTQSLASLMVGSLEWSGLG